MEMEMATGMEKERSGRMRVRTAGGKGRKAGGSDDWNGRRATKKGQMAEDRRKGEVDWNK